MGAVTSINAHLGLAPRFEVTVEGHDLGGWQQCTGLEVDFSPYQLQEMGENTTVHNLRGQAKYQNIVLTRAVVSQMWNSETLKWLAKFQGIQRPGNATIVLYDAWGESVASWELMRVIPVKWKGPTLNSKQNEVATEVLTLAHEGFAGLAEPHAVALASLTEVGNSDHQINLQFNPKSVTQKRQNEPAVHNGYSTYTGNSSSGSASASDGFGDSYYGQAAVMMGMGLNTWSLSSVVFDSDYGASGGGGASSVREIDDQTLMRNVNLLFKWMQTHGSGQKKSSVVLLFAWPRFLSEPAFVHLGSTTVKYVRLRHNGTPSRVEISLTLTEVAPSDVTANQNPTSGGPGGHRTCRVVDGESLASVAYREYGEAGVWPQLARFNRIDDPFRMRTGRVLQIPTRRILDRA
ncbi:MAG TPA: phage tail protein [Acidimicrobiales bacterium]|jgi:phage tail-like protein|nr:phage tail protein [Acidimicrobiales bacterium]